MREPEKPVAPGREVEAKLMWPDDGSLSPGASVEASDGPLGILRERRQDAGPEPSYLGVETREGMLYVPERLVRETHGATIILSLPAADVRANSRVRRRIDRPLARPGYTPRDDPDRR